MQRHPQLLVDCANPEFRPARYSTAMSKQSSSVFSVDVTGLERGAGLPAHVRIYDRIRMAISSGSLVPNARLPSSRMLAKDLGVARNTVDDALSQLVADGYVMRRRGAGTFVAARLPERDSPPLLCAPTPAAKGPVTQRRLSQRAHELTSYPGHYRPLIAVPFAPSLPPVNLFPRQ